MTLGGPKRFLLKNREKKFHISGVARKLENVSQVSQACLSSLSFLAYFVGQTEPKILPLVSSRYDSHVCLRAKSGLCQVSL